MKKACTFIALNYDLTLTLFIIKHSGSTVQILRFHFFEEPRFFIVAYTRNLQNILTKPKLNTRFILN
jgi:hypothetical protein